MDTEETKPSKSKKFLKIALSVFGILVVLLSTAYVLTARKNAKQAEEQALVNVTEATREPTEAEKLVKAQNEELDRLRAQYQTQSSSSAMTNIQNQVKSLEAIRKKANSITATKTLTQQSQELDALRSALNK